MARLRAESPENPQFRAQNMWASFAILALEQAVEQEEVAKRMEVAAMIDPLTNLRNSRALEKTFSDLVQHTPLNRQNDPKNEAAFKPHSLIVFDIDNFKEFNSQYGRRGGDEALQKFAQNLRQGAFRLSEGADEFAELAPYTTESEAFNIAMKILARQNAAGLEASVGVAEINTLESLAFNMHRADEAAYAAKRNGRNQVVRRSQIDEPDKLALRQA